MAEDVRKKTKFIFRSLLTLGVLEGSNSPLTKNEILEKVVGIYSETADLDKYIKHLKLWLDKINGNLVLINNRQNRNVIEVDFNQINSNEYIEFLEVLLTLNEILQRTPDDAVRNLASKDGEKPLSIITKLILAIQNSDELKIYYRISNREFESIFEPSMIKRNNNEWVVEGELENLEIPQPLQIKNIVKIQ